MRESSPIMQEAFKPQVSLTNDHQVLPGELEPAARNVSPNDKSHLAWGLGLGLELNDEAEAIKAFHTGDMNQYRSQVALDLERKSSIVYFANGRDHREANGHVLGPLIISEKIPLNHAHNWFYGKFQFAKHKDELIGGPKFGLRKPEASPRDQSYVLMTSKMPPNLKNARELHLDEEEAALESLDRTAYTTGAGANCFFQALIHTLCYQDAVDKNKLMDFPGALKLIEVFNREIPQMAVQSMDELITLAKAMHPLERELIFGPLMRTTLNELNMQDSKGKPLTLEKESIVFAEHAIAFTKAFGLNYEVYTHVDDATGMPEELKTNQVGEYYKEDYSVDNAAGALQVRLKSCHFEVSGLPTKAVESHQAQIIPQTLASSLERPELPGARFYDSPSSITNCSVENAQESFETTVSSTLLALQNREGPHLEIINRANRGTDGVVPSSRSDDFTSSM
jgi:hypothetical protein